VEDPQLSCEHKVIVHSGQEADTCSSCDLELDRETRFTMGESSNGLRKYVGGPDPL
jgi:hypothetical protein